MFTYFHQHKCRYDKGQIAPLMILVLVILIIMAMVTVNLYKVAMDKTYSANSVDAGALAAGSVMANIFNALGSSNAEMKKGYELAFYSIATTMTIALIYLGFASGSAGSSIGLAGAAIGLAPEASCVAVFPAADAVIAAGSAKASTAIASAAITSAIIATSALYTAQLYFYGKLRETARDGRLSAMEQGHKFLFYNSGLGSRLPEGIPEGSSWTKSRTDFSKFLDTINAGDNKFVADTYRFDWQDGQGRAHFVESRVTTGDLDRFDLIVTLMPFPVLMGLLIGARIATAAATGALIAANAPYGGAATVALPTACSLEGCCFCAQPTCCAAWEGAVIDGIELLATGGASATAAIGSMALASGLLIAVRFGLFPNRGNPIPDDHMGLPAAAFIICWIDDIIHDRRLRVESVTSQEGGDLGLVKTEYPVVKSYSVVDFKGNGKILPTKSEDLSFDASIIETDVIGKKE